MLIECDNCGAPLDIKEGATTSKCAYCGKTSRVQSLRTVAQQTPPDWKPPKTWTPPEHMPAPHAPLAFQAPAVARRAIALAGTASTLGLLAVGGVVAYNVASATNAIRGIPKNGGLPADLTETLNRARQEIEGAAKTAAGVAQTAGNVAPPVVCSGNERVTVTQKVIASNGTPVVASVNCEVTLIGCTVSGATAILASENARVRIEGGVVTGTSGPAIKATGNAQITLTGEAMAVGEPALWVLNNAKVELDHASARGRVTAATTGHNASVDARKGALQGALAGTRSVKR